VRAFITEPALQQRLAKYLVHECFRNSELENLHAGVVPDSKTGDSSDVIVKTPFGDLPWRDLSRFDDAEMKRLMIDVVNRTFLFIHRLFDEETGGELLLRLPVAGRIFAGRKLLARTLQQPCANPRSAPRDPGLIDSAHRVASSDHSA
jgi:hypothetical protein